MYQVRLTQSQIENWVARHFEYKRRKHGEELLICNPFTDDNKFKFNICTKLTRSKKSKAMGYWCHDWRPTAHEYDSSFIKFVQRYKGLTFKEALQEVCGDSIDLRAIMCPPKKVEDEPEPEVIFKLPDMAVPITDERFPRAREFAINYLESRRVSYSDAKAFRIHYTPTMVVFPYLEYDMIVYWQGRTLVDKQFRFPDEGEVGRGKSDFLYGFDNAEIGGQVYIAEAIFGALSLGPGGLASGGAQMQERQVRKVRALNPSIVVLAPDNDEEGIRSLRPNYQLLSPYYTIYYSLPPKGFKDWNELDQKHGAGSARRCMLDTMAPLTLAKLMSLTMVRPQ